MEDDREFPGPDFRERLWERVEDMSERLESLELLGFQAQIDQMDARLKALEETCLRLERAANRGAATGLSDLANLIVHEIGHPPTLPPWALDRGGNLRARLDTVIVQARERFQRLTTESEFAATRKVMIDEFNRVLVEFDMGERIAED